MSLPPRRRSTTLDRLAPPYLRRITPYVPGKPIEELERELGIQGAVKLASNENPLGPSERAVEAVRRACATMHLYPEGGTPRLRGVLAGRLGLSRGQVLTGNGSNEGIELLVRAFLPARGEAVAVRPSFLVYDLVVRAAGGTLRSVPLLKTPRGYRYEARSILKACSSKTRLVFLANPNNPTGTVMETVELDRLIEGLPSKSLLVLDEAYREFAAQEGFPDGVERVRRGVPVVVLRTFSKAYALAGLRVGYAAGPAEVIAVLDRVRQPFNVNALAEAAALAALEDAGHLRRTLETVRAGMQQLTEGLERMGLPPEPSQANFLLVDLKRRALPVYEALLRKAVIVRPMHAYGLPSCLRVTIGTAEENHRFLEALAAVLPAS